MFERGSAPSPVPRPCPDLRRANRRCLGLRLRVLSMKCEDGRVSDGRVRYARNGDARLAYRVFGEGDTTLVWIPGWFSNVDMYDDPATPFTAVMEQLAEVIRVIVWDKRGTGLSDPATHVPPLDERMDDLHAVLDAVEVDRPALFGQSEGGPMSLLFAATYPERVRSLVMYGAMARFSQEIAEPSVGIYRRTEGRSSRRYRKPLG